MKKKSLSAKKIIHRKIFNHLKDKKILKVYDNLQNSLLLNKHNKFAIGVSGGADSLALTFLAKCFSTINKIDIKYYIVDHRLRRASSSEAKKVQEVLKKYDIKTKILSWIGKKPTSNIQSLARSKRYALLTNQCKKDGVQNLLLGHHVDDLYENFIIRLLRGSGLKGLTSFSVRSELRNNNINIIRPLINSTKSELIYISRKVFDFFINDPSNDNENFKRIKIRNLIKKLEKEGLDKKKLKLTIENLQDSNQTIVFYVKANLHNNAIYLKDKNQYILNKFFFNQSHEVTFRSFSNVLKMIGKKYYSPRGKSIESLIVKIKSNKISKLTLAGCYIQKINQTVLISKEK